MRLQTELATRHPWMMLRPTPPQPMTATRSPGRTPAVWMAAPTPVVTAQPTSAATGKGMSSGMGTTAVSRSMVLSAKVAALRPWYRGVLPRRSRVVPSSMLPKAATPL